MNGTSLTPVRLLATLLAGALFGFGLALSSMIQPEVVLSFLRLQDFGLALVCASVRSPSTGSRPAPRRASTVAPWTTG